ncbi:hypothetical protein D3C75_937070 [compost metagenome]
MLLTFHQLEQYGRRSSGIIQRIVMLQADPEMLGHHIQFVGGQLLQHFFAEQVGTHVLKLRIAVGGPVQAIAQHTHIKGSIMRDDNLSLQQWFQCGP